MPRINNLSPLSVYPGSKRKVVDLIWERFGTVNRYVESFLGSGAVWLGRPGENLNGYGEIVNDRSGLIVNVWRSMVQDPEQLATIVDWPGTTNDLEARQKACFNAAEGLSQKLEEDPTYCDVQLAAWTVYGLSWATHARSFMNDGHCRVGRPSATPAGAHAVSRPPMHEWFAEIKERTKKAVILCDDWKKSVTPALLHSGKNDICAVFLDPPYGEDRRTNLYQVDSKTVYMEVLEWAIANADNNRIRICVAGYDGEHNVLEEMGWEVLAWSSAQGGESRHKERLWFSPSCINASAGGLFDG
jgi:DNA adenine methylase